MHQKITDDELLMFLRANGIGAKRRDIDPDVFCFRLWELVMVISPDERIKAERLHSQLIKKKDFLTHNVCMLDKSSMLTISVSAYREPNMADLLARAGFTGFKPDVSLCVETGVDTTKNRRDLETVSQLLCKRMGIEYGSGEFFGIARQSNLL